MIREPFEAGCPEEDHWAPFDDGGIPGPEAPDYGEESSGPPSKAPEGLPEDVKYPEELPEDLPLLTPEDLEDLPEGADTCVVRNGLLRGRAIFD